eukprot:185675_1
MASCFRGCWFWTFFATSMLLICGYMIYSGWWLPIQIHKHRLRYNQLVPFELYTVDRADWVQYNMDTQHIEIISYSQQIPFEYEYFIGLFTTNESLVNVSWNSLSELVANTQSTSPLYIVQYSATECTDLSTCFSEYVRENELSNEGFAYTRIDKEHQMNVNSEVTSKLLDGPRDVFQFIIMFILCLWIVVLLEYFDDEDAEACQQWGYLILTMFFGFCYFLWILTLSVIPIFFANPAHMTTLDYWQTTEYSLVYNVGDYDAEWWVAGVMMHGIWQWCLVLSCPLCCCIYMVLIMLCCCNTQRADNIGKVIVVPLMFVACIGIVFGTIGFIPVFIVNMSMWNHETYLNGSGTALMALQVLIGLGVILIIVPLYAVILSAITKCVQTKSDRPRMRALDSMKGSVRKLPVIGSERHYKSHTGGHSGGAYGKVAMSKYDDYDVYN